MFDFFSKTVNKIRAFWLNTSGIIAIEAVIVFIPMMLVVMLICELASIIFISSAIDGAMADSMLYSSATANRSADYKARFLKRMKEEIAIIPLLYNEDKLHINVKYYQSVDNIIQNRPAVSAEDSPLAMYSITYQYQPIFLPLPKKLFHDGLQRQMIYIQENQRIRAADSGT